ncbi:MAG: chalcone isomerase family protein [Alphaproteobacteria bacterium]|nr:chalcone isomerase family protein [Alphaproteobacteria bacterium]
MKKLRAFSLLLAALALLAVAPVQATTLAKYQEKTTRKVGESRLTWLVWDVYDAALYAPTGRFQATQPYVLELTYLRALDGAKVAAKAREEMVRLGFRDEAKLAKWQLQLTDWFQGIEKGTRLAAMRNADGSTTFVRNGKTVLGTLPDPQFGQYFFAIWLSERSLRPDLRRQLLGFKEVATR